MAARTLALSIAAASVLASLVVGGAGCTAARSPELRVLGVHEQTRAEVLFVQVRNPANQPLRLTKLEYRLASGGATVARGELALGREVPARSAVVVELPVRDGLARVAPLTLRGKLTAVTDQVVRVFNVRAQLAPEAHAAAN